MHQEPRINVYNLRFTDELTRIEKGIARAVLFLDDAATEELAEDHLTEYGLVDDAITELEQALKDLAALKAGQQILK